MIDTLGLYSRDYIMVKDRAEWGCNENRDPKNDYVKKRYYINDPLINIEFTESIEKGQETKSNLFYHLSLPKMLSNGVNNIDFDRGLSDKEIKGKIIKLLSPYVKVDDKDIKASRVDLYKNIEGYNTNMIDVIGSLPVMKRYNKNFYIDTNNAKTCLIYNKSKQWCLYDKRAELLSKHKQDINSPLIRSEARVLRASKDKVLNSLDMVLGLLYEAPEVLKEIYNKEVKNKVYDLNIDDVRDDIIGIKIIDDFLIGYALSNESVRTYIYNILEKAEINRKAKYRKLIKYNECLNFYNAFYTENKENIKGFFNELYYQDIVS